MLAPLRSKLDKMKIVLGSTSPRRRELLQNIMNFKIVPSEFDESTLKPSNYPTPADFVKDQAANKCNEIVKRGIDADMFITADTVVVIDGKILGKPGTHERAFQMISDLNGRSHSVVTGVCISLPKLNKYDSFYVETKVYFASLPDEVVHAYADSDDCLDKAGAYGIQSGAMSLITKIDGDYSNVVGLPVNAVCTHIYNMLKD